MEWKTSATIVTAAETKSVLSVDHAVRDDTREKVVARALLHEGRQIEKHAAIVVAEEVAWADDEKIGTRARCEGSRQLCAIHVGAVWHIHELDLHLVTIVPALSQIGEPFVLRSNPAAGSIELPELQSLRREAPGP